MKRDISLKIRADKLGKSLEHIATSVEEEIQAAVKNLAYAAHAAMIARVQSMNLDAKNRADYLRGLTIKDLGDNAYMIALDGEWANKLEDGFPSYSMKDVLLKSTKIVQVGSRSGLPWVRKAKDGHKWAVVPFQHRQPKGGNKSGDLASDIKEMYAVNASGKIQNVSKIFKDVDGKPITGKVATVTGAKNPNFEGLTKYQHVHESGAVSSVYMTFRAISEKGKGWQHPGFKGYQLFKEAEDYIEKELDNIINTLIK